MNRSKHSTGTQLIYWLEIFVDTPSQLLCLMDGFALIMTFCSKKEKNERLYFLGKGGHAQWTFKSEPRVRSKLWKGVTIEIWGVEDKGGNLFFYKSKKGYNELFFKTNVWICTVTNELFRFEFFCTTL